MATESPSLPNEFLNMLKNATHSEKKAMLLAISNSLKSDLDHNKSANIEFVKYVEVAKNFVPENFLDEALMAEVTSLGLCKSSTKPLTQWLSGDDRPYCFSNKPNLKHDSKDIRNYPTICNLMDLVNNDPRTTQDSNAALVMVYNNNNAGIGFHDDAESLIDSQSSISTITFGSSRTVDFCDHTLRPRVPQYSVECCDHDMMIMKPGCQKELVHKVCKGNGSDGIRVIISFRKIVDNDPEISFDTFSPRSGESFSQTLTNVTQQRPKVTVIAGDSFITGLDAGRLGRKGRRNVINLAQGGASVDVTSKQIDSYFLSLTDEHSSPVVEKFIICVGTNDIRNCRENGVRHLKRPLILLIEKIKLLFPDATVWFQSLIPLIVQNQFSVKNILQYNNLLFEVCSYMKIYFLDVFGIFLKYDHKRQGLFRNEFLFVSSKNIHLNKIGLGLLAKTYIRIIHANKFNPLGF